MSQTKFTPGDWIAKKYAGPYPEMWVETDEEPIAKVESTFDLYLIAASKEMYEALRQIATGTDPSTDGEAWIFVEIAKKIANQALAKARVETTQP